MKKLNWEIIAGNIAEAREQLEAIESSAKAGEPPSEIEFRQMLEHAYHHLNFAWNARRVKSERYRSLTDEEFNKWGGFPKRMKAYKIRRRKKKKADRK